MKYDVIVIGSGLSGLAAGIRLAMFDKKVLIIETILEKIEPLMWVYTP
jgi:phytoene dehydrogenase-like protein